MDVFIFIPASVALLVKIAIAYFSRRQLFKSEITRTFTFLLVVLTISNIVELLGYYFLDTTQFSTIGLKLYYACLLFMFACLLQISILIVNKGVGKRIALVNYAICTILSCLIVFTDLIVAGAISIGYTLTKLSGEYYYLFQLYAVSMLMLSLGVCIYGYKKSEVHYNRIQSMYVLIAVFFLALPILVALFLMSLEIELSAAVILPIGMTLFLIIITYALNAEGLYDLRVWVPGTKMFQLHRSLHKEFVLNLDGSQMSAKELVQAHERRYIIQALIQANGSQKKAAELLQVSVSTISQKRKKYGI